MLNIIKKYYIAPFAGVLVVTALKTFTKESTKSFAENITTVLLSTLVISLVVGTVYYLQDTKWGPNKRDKAFNKSPFSDLLMNRFVIKDNAVVGIVNGFTVVVAYVWPHGASAVAVNVLFDPNICALYKGDLEDIKERNHTTGILSQDYTWTNGSIGYVHDDTFTLPAYDTVLKMASTMISVLKAEGLQPISYEESEKRKLATTTAITSIGV